MADDPLFAALEEIRERHECVFDAHGRADLIAAINAVRDDAPRLLAALDAVLKATEVPTTLEGRGFPGDGEAVRRAVRAAITRELAGEEAGNGL